MPENAEMSVAETVAATEPLEYSKIPYVIELDNDQEIRVTPEVPPLPDEPRAPEEAESASLPSPCEGVLGER